MNLVRWPNLLILALIPTIIRYGFIVPLKFDYRLNTWQFVIFVIGILLASATGYIVNDIYDVTTDKINKPKKTYIGSEISEKSAWIAFFTLAILSVSGAWYYSKMLDIKALVWIPMIIIAMLWLYSADFKGRVLLGNLIISLLAAINVFMEVVFDVFPAITPENAEYQYQAAMIVGAWSLFAFWITLMRELVKDLEDRRGDSQAGYRTLAVIWTDKPIKTIILTLATVLLAGVSTMAYFAGDQWIASGYITLFLVLPTAFSIYKLYMAETPKEYHFISTLYKFIMFFGLLALAVFSYEYISTIG